MCDNPFCVAVDRTGHASTFDGGRALIWDGSGWGDRTLIDPAQRSGVAAVSCVSRRFCQDVDSVGDAITYTR